MITRPMLAAVPSGHGYRFPLLVTPKIDGFRFLKVGGRALTRSMRPIVNDHVRQWIETHLPDGVDGEITVGGSFHGAQSALAKRDGEPDFRVWLFDFVEGDLERPYALRANDLADAIAPSDRVTVLTPAWIDNQAQLDAYEAKALAQGHEGIMLRDPAGPYKCGRSTEEEGYLLKVKSFRDAEAVVIGTFARSDAPRQLGGFVCLANGKEFRVGYNHTVTGDSAGKAWGRRVDYVGKTLRYTYQPHGTHEAPRHPVFAGFREDWDR